MSISIGNNPPGFFKGNSISAVLLCTATDDGDSGTVTFQHGLTRPPKRGYIMNNNAQGAYKKPAWLSLDATGDGTTCSFSIQAAAGSGGAQLSILVMGSDQDIYEDAYVKTALVVTPPTSFNK